MGFVCLDGPEIEDDYHNFTALKYAAFASSARDARYFLFSKWHVIAYAYVDRSNSCNEENAAAIAHGVHWAVCIDVILILHIRLCFIRWNV